MKFRIYFFLLAFISALPGLAQANEGIDDDSLSIGGDIFSDFNEDLESSQVLEDERFYRYGRFYSFVVSSGFTTFTGNRGKAYIDNHPSIGLSLVYFMDFNVAFGIGVEYSRHNMLIDYKTESFNAALGAIEINMFRSYMFYRYYVDTSDLSTAITYSNPYVVGRIEYWRQTSKFINQPTIPNDTDGSLGFALGVGFEFPIQLKKSYIGAEFLYHWVTFKDTYNQRYRPRDDESYGINDLEGDGLSAFLSFVLTW